MAAKPIERYVKKQIADQGGWDRILERIASGQTRTAIAKTFYRVDNGKPIDRSTFANMLHRWKRQSPENAAKLAAADKESADAHAELSVEIMHDAPCERDAIQKARLESEANLRYAGKLDRERWGDKPAQFNVQVNTGIQYLDALRHREVNLSTASSSDREANVLQACETEQLPAVQDARE